MKEQPEQRYPLTWPPGWRRTPDWQRTNSAFKTPAPGKAMQDLTDELERLGGRRIIVSSNLLRRADGVPAARQPRMDDQGIAVYFTRNGREMVLACDKFAKREDNLRAITKTIDAIRGIERWGSSDMMERAFTGFTALPAPEVFDCWAELGLEQGASGDAIEAAYRRKRSECHPDKGGSDVAFQRVERAYREAMEVALGIR